MAWMITCDDSIDGSRLRADSDLMAAHWAHELSIKDKILATGSIRSDDGQTPTGSLTILDVESRADALALFERDPATVAGMRTNVQIAFWNPAILDRRELK